MLVLRVSMLVMVGSPMRLQAYGSRWHRLVHRRQAVALPTGSSLGCGRLVDGKEPVGRSANLAHAAYRGVWAEINQFVKVAAGTRHRRIQSLLKHRCSLRQLRHFCKSLSLAASVVFAALEDASVRAGVFA